MELMLNKEVKIELDRMPRDCRSQEAETPGILGNEESEIQEVLVRERGSEFMPDDKVCGEAGEWKEEMSLAQRWVLCVQNTWISRAPPVV